MQNKKKRALILVLILLVCAFVASLGWFLVDRFVDRSGWYQAEDGAYYYRDFHWRKVTGWQRIDGRYYYFGDDYLMETDWLEWEGNRYRLGSDGALDFGWLEVDGQWYYAQADGALITGWQALEGNRYFFREDGSAYTGWMDLNGKKHHFGEDGVQTIGFYTDNNCTWFFGDDGAMLTGEQILEGKVYLFNEDGTMYTGWLDTEDGRRYYLADGPMATLWETIRGKHYYFGDNGILQTGWLQDGEYQYYLQEDGSAAVGPVTVDGQLRFFTPAGIHVVLVNHNYAVPKYWDTEYVEVEEWKLVSTVCYDALMQMMADCLAAGNDDLYFNSGYRSRAAQEEIMEIRISEHIYEYGIDYNEAYKMARRSVALPGYSEHHLGLAVDLTGENAKAWLQEHCWEYGFIARYPGDKEEITGVMDEPWHFRYVGTRVSLDMEGTGLCLEEYLGAA